MKRKKNPKEKKNLKNNHQELKKEILIILLNLTFI